jgi:acyl-CoA dehydrogenase
MRAPTASRRSTSSAASSALNGGRAVQAFFKEVGEFCEENRADEKMAPFTKALKKGLNDLQAATMWLMQNGMAKPDNAGAGLDRLHASLRPGGARLHVGAHGEGGAGEARRGRQRRRVFYENKLVTGAISWSA